MGPTAHSNHTYSRKLGSSLRSLADGESLPGSLLFGHSDGSLVSSSDVSRFLSDMELNVTVGSEIWGDSSVSSVCSSSALDGSLSGNMGDLTLVGVESLSL